jgi:hypothetical protein
MDELAQPTLCSWQGSLDIPDALYRILRPTPLHSPVLQVLVGKIIIIPEGHEKSDEETSGKLSRWLALADKALRHFQSHPEGPREQTEEEVPEERVG